MNLRFRGRPPILIADSVKSVVGLTDPYAKEIMDRMSPVENFVFPILSQSVFDWTGRNPRPALDADGDFQCTDLDLFSFLMPLADRGAIIEIPRYRNRRQVVVKESERKIGSNNFGPLHSLVSNQEAFSFSVKIIDQTIMKTNPETGKETLGEPRNYMIVDVDGHWYYGWDCIRWNPTAPENRFLTEKGLWTGNSVYFQFYVHPNRWRSIFGAPYLLLKMLSSRLTEEGAFYRNEVKRLEDLGFRLPPGEKKEYEPSISESTTRPITVSTMETILDLPPFNGSYPRAINTRNGLLAAYHRQKYLTYVLKPLVQFALRADEAAYFQYGARDMKIAPWLDSRAWKTGWRPPKGRVDWNLLVLSNDVGLRWRLKDITQQVYVTE
ncbi:MAG: hypothetical protein PHT40_03015 [Patescibacteria group bacterium]|nr:hypothetical protein [Patescibacteria group bacterium]